MRARFRHAVLVMLDAAIAAVSILASLWLLFEGALPEQYVRQLPLIIPWFVGLRLGMLWAFRSYSRLWRYATVRDAVGGALAVAVSSLLLYGVNSTELVMTLPTSVFFIEGLLFLNMAAVPRLFVRWRRNVLLRARQPKAKRVLIVGAGDAGAMLAREFEKQPWLGVQVVGFVDDDVTKIHHKLGGVRVLGNRRQIPELVKRKSIERIIIAMPSAEPAVLRETMALCKETGAELKMLPPLAELVAGQVTVQDVRDVEIEDLLRREPVETDLTAISGYLRGKRVLVTGAGGSIGGELCRQVCTFAPAELVLLDHSENNVFEIDTELRDRFPRVPLVPVVADIRHRKKIECIFALYKPQIVFHAAAHKHVPLMEANPDEAVANNVLGTRNVAEAAARHGAERFVMVSTDKAVNPSNVMGATKRVAELVVQAMQRTQVASENGPDKPATRFVSVRFGNVLGSRGSVIPMFREQIRQGGPVKVTHPAMTRYFMTIPEAVQLILQAAAMGQGGEVFVLDMGEPVRIADLARDLIRLSGLVPGKDIEIVYSGVRPGEKLFEELIYDDETVTVTGHEKIMALNGHAVDPVHVAETIRRLESLLEAGPEPADRGARLVDVLFEAVGGRQTPVPAIAAGEAASGREEEPATPAADSS